MQLKTYRGIDLAAALEQARRELGPDALVLATNEVRGRLGLTSVEITVAADSRVQDGASELKQLGRGLKEAAGRGLRPRTPAPALRDAGGPASLRLGLSGGRRREEGGRERGARAGRAPQPALRDELDSLPQEIRIAVRKLVRSGLSADLALRFSRAAEEVLGGGDERRLEVVADRAMRALLTFAPLSEFARVTLVVGPPGAGKTTTAAKLAARLAHAGADRVLLAETDLDGVGSLALARHHAQGLGVELVEVRDGAELAALVGETGRSAAIVVDTAGIGRADADRLERVSDLCRAVAGAAVALLVPSGLHGDAARDVLARFAPLAPTCVGFSKVDDALCLGELVNALAPAALPLAFVTTGRGVPRDLEDASPRGLTALLLRSGFVAERRTELGA